MFPEERMVAPKMKRFIFWAIILPLLVSCAKHEVDKSTIGNSVYLALAPSETRNHPVTWGGSPHLEPGLDPKDILLFEDFEDDHYRKRWRVHWNEPVGAGTVARPSKYVFSGNRSAYLENKEEKHEADGAGEYVPVIPMDDVAYFRLYLRMQDGFSTGTSDQVKLISMRGAVDIENSYGGAGIAPGESDLDGFAADLCIDGARNLHFYYYHLDQAGGWGDITYCKMSFFRGAKISPGKWYCLELMLRTNTPRQKNGQLAAWLDGKLVGHVDKIRFRNSEKVKIQRLAVYSYFGGSDYEDASPKDQRIYVDNIVISRKPIGCLISNL
jgi:hypothetical protein